MCPAVGNNVPICFGHYRDACCENPECGSKCAEECWANYEKAEEAAGSESYGPDGMGACE